MMFIIKVLGVYFIINALSWIRAISGNLLFDTRTTPETDRNFQLMLAILFAAIIIREGLW